MAFQGCAIGFILNIACPVRLLSTFISRIAREATGLAVILAFSLERGPAANYSTYEIYCYCTIYRLYHVRAVPICVQVQYVRIDTGREICVVV